MTTATTPATATSEPALEAVRIADGLKLTDMGNHVVVSRDGQPIARVKPPVAELVRHLHDGGHLPEGETIRRVVENLLRMRVLVPATAHVDTVAPPQPRLRRAGPLSVRLELWRPDASSRFPFVAAPRHFGTTAFLVAVAFSAIALRDIRAEFGTLLAKPIGLTGAAALVVLGLITVGFHELGHAVALLRRGGKPRAFGVGTIYGMPIAFCDVTSLWLLRRRSDRVAVMLGGVTAQVFCSGLAAIVYLWWPAGRTILALYLVGNGLSAVANLIPLLPLDGFWLLAVAIDKPPLRENAQDALTNVTRWLMGAAPMPRRMRRAVLLVGFRLLCLAAVASVLSFGALNYRMLAESFPQGPRAWAIMVCAGLTWSAVRFLRWLRHMSKGARTMPCVLFTLVLAGSVGALLTAPRFTASARLSVQIEDGAAFIEPSSAVRSLLPNHVQARAVTRQGLAMRGTPWFEITPPPGRWPVPQDSLLIGNALEVRLEEASPARLLYTALWNALAR